MKALAPLIDALALRLELRLERLLLKRPTSRSSEWGEAILGLQSCLALPLERYLEEAELAELEETVRRGIASIPKDAPLPLVHNADRGLARLCYALCRATRPAIVLETGVAYGVTTRFMLRALELNGAGELHSVDRPPPVPGAAERVGLLVPPELRARWRLHRGSSRAVLPRLLPSLGAIGLFLHDSRHTYRNIRAELRGVAPHLGPGAVVLVDDAERNRAFEEHVAATRPRFWAVAREEVKAGLLGMSVH